MKLVWLETNRYAGMYATFTSFKDLGFFPFVILVYASKLCSTEFWYYKKNIMHFWWWVTVLGLALEDCTLYLDFNQTSFWNFNIEHLMTYRCILILRPKLYYIIQFQFNQLKYIWVNKKGCKLWSNMSPTYQSVQYTAPPPIHVIFTLS